MLWLVSSSTDSAPSPGPASLRLSVGDAVTQAGLLPPHSPTCAGCGPDNPHGLHLSVRREEDAVVADHVFDARHVGAPGVAHGGAIAMAFDDLCGFLLYVLGELAVTRHLAVDYLTPVRLGDRYRLQAQHGPRDGRRLPVTATMVDTSGHVVAKANATFVVVGVDHFERAAGNQ